MPKLTALRRARAVQAQTARLYRLRNHARLVAGKITTYQLFREAEEAGRAAFVAVARACGHDLEPYSEGK